MAAGSRGECSHPEAAANRGLKGGHLAADSGCECTHPGPAATEVPAGRVSRGGYPSALQRWQGIPDVSAHIGKRLPSEGGEAAGWRQLAHVSTSTRSRRWTPAGSRPRGALTRGVCRRGQGRPFFYESFTCADAMGSRDSASSPPEEVLTRGFRRYNSYPDVGSTWDRELVRPARHRARKRARHSPVNGIERTPLGLSLPLL
jgi:hypothetical protein